MTVYIASGRSLSRSCATASHKVMHPVLPFRKYFVSGVSKNLGSCGTTLSSMEMTLQCFFILRVMYPSDGAKNDIQYLTISTSGFQSLMARYVLIYEKGLTVSSREVLSTGTASSSSVTNCVLPGKRISGYCRLKLNALTT